MFKRFIPDYHAASVYDVEIQFFLSHGIKNLLIDLDNTLDSYKLFSPSKRAVVLKEKLIAAGINVFIISNNHGPRVTAYATALGVEYLHSTRKPFAYKVKRLLKEKKYRPEETMLVGDQLITDVLCAKRAGIRVLLTEKIVTEDQWTTHFNRLLDRPIRRYLKKKGRLKEWMTND
ncbi:MAG: YqeG family HAD IIIA-type phosphatase [Firmicutes bacterium]|nr:YqeG family HAD IIIA-type phosphatase [Bacillota bacterium]